jgi:GT2 family glycosyltransferase
VVEHRYSHSAGKASALKAYYVERNRLFVIFKNFPLLDLLLVPFYAMSRYFWHFVYALGGRGKAAEFQREAAAWLACPGTLCAPIWNCSRDFLQFGASAAG